MTNILQKLVSDISGYDPEGNGARNDYYYTLGSAEAKRECIRDYADKVLDVEITYEMADAVYNFIETEFTNENERFHAFQALREAFNTMG